MLSGRQAVLTAGQLTVSVGDTPSVHHSDQVCLRLAGTAAGSVSDDTHMPTRIPGKGRKQLMQMEVPQTLDGELPVPGQALPASLSGGGVSCDTVPQGRVTLLCAPAVFSRISATGRTA